MLDLLERNGCNKFQILECPKLLNNISADDVKIAREKLLKCGCQQFSMPLIHLALSTKTLCALKSKSELYINNLEGSSSVVDYWTLKLQLDPKDLEELSCKNYRLLSFSSVAIPTKKLVLLLSSGISLSEVRNHSHILLNKSYALLEKRINQLASFGLNKPFPLQLLVQAEFIYRYSLARLVDSKAREVILDDAKPEELNTHNLPNGFKSLRSKWQFLTGKGFHPTEILNYPPILCIGEHRLQVAYGKLNEMGVEKITLPRLVSYAKHMRITQQSNRMTRVLEYLTGKCLHKHILEEFSDIHSQKSETIVANYDFFRKIGFSDDHLAELPVILAHDSQLLELAWNEAQHLPDAKNWQDNPALMLNILQYIIEKKTNFKSAIVLEYKESICS